MRNQLAALRDGVEEELSHISYDQLDANLKKKIDELNNSLSIQKNQTDIVAQTLQAKYITAEQIAANYASFGAIDAVSARVSVIESDYITTTQLKAVTIDASQITSGKISANQIDAHGIAATAFQGEDLHCNELTVMLDASFDSINVAAGIVTDELDVNDFYWKDHTIVSRTVKGTDGKTYNALVYT